MDRLIRDHLLAILQASIQAAMPDPAIRRAVRLEGERLAVGGVARELGECERIVLLGAGKASAAMARSMEEMLGDRIDRGLVITKYGHGLELARTRVMEAGHPVPDRQGMAGAEALLAMAEGLTERDLAICLISGGASALTPLPVSGVSLADKQEATRQLLACGATIHEINAIRKHLSRIKGGRLAQALFPATVHSLIISDVIGDDLDVIGSGMTAPDRSTFAACLDIINRYGLEESMPKSVKEHLANGMRGMSLESPGPGEPCFEKLGNHIVAGNGQSLEAAVQEAGRLGYHPRVLTDSMSGEAREMATTLAAAAGEVAGSGSSFLRPACILAGGETTVTIRGQGLGGRNQEMALALALALGERPELAARSAAACLGTDGTDGPTDAAGAMVFPDTLERAAGLGLHPLRYLDDNDSHHFFQALDDLVITGPTLTNVMDLVVLLVE